MKNVLINNFGERHSIEELYDKLRSVVFKTSAVDFYDEIKDKLRNLNNKTAMVLGVNVESEQIAANNMLTALSIFKEKVPEPLRTILACRNPDTLEEAIEILFKSGYAYYGFGNNRNLSKFNDNRRLVGNVAYGKKLNQNNNTGLYNRYNYDNIQGHNSNGNQFERFDKNSNNRNFPYQFPQPDWNIHRFQNNRHSQNSYGNRLSSNNNHGVPEPMDINTVHRDTIPHTNYNTHYITDSDHLVQHDSSMLNENMSIPEPMDITVNNSDKFHSQYLAQHSSRDFYNAPEHENVYSNYFDISQNFHIPASLETYRI